MQITMNVDKKGTAPGTVGWLARELEGCTLGTGTTRIGFPAVFLRREKDGKRESFTLALYGHVTGYDAPARFVIWPDTLDMYEPVELLGVNLTDAARDKLRELANLAYDILREWMDDADNTPLEFAALPREKN